ncbi:MAG TPA: hypothetical protein VFI84_01710 [Candidatus Saccharimonadales bacterium]|nr:hypothetical protein [Candidatus Saccharimonadales bacterium]
MSTSNPNQGPQPSFSPAAAEMLGRIASATLRSDVRGLNPDLFHMVREGQISPEEMGVIQEAAREKHNALTYKPSVPPEEVPLPDAITTEEPWSPSGSLRTIKEPTWHSHAEYSQPNGDKEL